MNQSQQYHYKGMDPDLDEYLSEYKNQTPLESDHYAGKCLSSSLPPEILFGETNYVTTSVRAFFNPSSRQVSFFSRTNASVHILSYMI